MNNRNMTVNKKVGADFKILQITDTQIIDPSQMAFKSRLNPESIKRWASAEDNCFKYIRKLISLINPDYIVLTGDNVYGSFDADGSNFKALVDLLDSYGIAWSLVFGNHDGETYDLEDPLGAAHPWGKGYEWQMDYLLNHTKNCLFDRGPLGIDNSCHGNYAVTVKEGDKSVYILFMLDSHDGVTENFGITKGQVDWYISKIESVDGAVVPSVIFQHIPLYHHFLASLKYTVDGNGLITQNNEILPNGDWGNLRDNVSYNSETYENYSRYMWWAIQKYGSTQAVCVGHYHTNAMRINYKGMNDNRPIQLVFGVKSSTYDYGLQLGGTLITLKDGKKSPEIVPVYLDENN